jgi:hypothetical protein
MSENMISRELPMNSLAGLDVDIVLCFDFDEYKNKPHIY